LCTLLIGLPSDLCGPDVKERHETPEIRVWVLTSDTHTGGDATCHDADQIWFVMISAMRTHSVFSWMRHDASEMKKSIFDAMLCFRTIGKVSEVGQI